MIGGFYRPDAGSHPPGRPRARRRSGLEVGASRHRPHLPDHAAVRLAQRARQRADRSAPRPARQPVGQRRHRRRPRASPRACSPSSATPVRSDVPAGDLAHVDRRLVEIARALATAPAVLLLDEPAAGLMRADKAALSAVLRRLADAGLAVILVEHDMALVMGISDHVVVLDAGRPIAAGAPSMRCATTPRCKEAYLGSGEMRARPRAVPRCRMPRRSSWRPTRSQPATAPCRCCTASPSRCAAASWWRCSVPTAPASRPSCARSAACFGPCPARSVSAARASSGSRRTASLPPASPWCRRAARCSPSSACATISCSARHARRTAMSRPRPPRCSSASRA